MTVEIREHQRKIRELEAELKSYEVVCGVCSKDWQEETEEVEDWIQCEMCEEWYHWQCQNIFGSVAPKGFATLQWQ